MSDEVKGNDVMFKRRIKNDVAKAITSVATCIVESDASFRQRAREVAQKFGPERILTLPQFFHNPSKKPNNLEEHFNGLGHWMSVCQFAAFEILYNLGEAALPLLRKIAFGEYDWTQGNAIEILCRLAAEGVDREQIISDLRRELPDMRYEAHLYAAGPMLKQAATNPAIAEVLQSLVVAEFQEAIEELRGKGDQTM
jgi:hypothetical protein